MQNNPNIKQASAEPTQEIEAEVNALQAEFQQMRDQLAQVIVGMEDVIEQLLIAILCRSHCILQGMPGLAQDPTNLPAR